MPPALDLELIKTFLTVLEVEGFKPAAHRLNKTPAAVSMQIKRLEEILGQRILERSNQGIALTPAGEVLKDRGQRLMSLNYELFGELCENELFGQLNFGAPTDYTPTVLRDLLPVFQREFPRIRPKIVLDPSRSLRPKIHSGELDMAIVAREPDSDEGIELWTEEIAWFGSANCTDGIPQVGLLSTDCVLRDQAIRQLKDGRGTYKTLLTASSVASLRDAVEADFCQAFLPVSMSSAQRSPKRTATLPVFRLTFCLIATPRFNAQTLERVASKFRQRL